MRKYTRFFVASLIAGLVVCAVVLLNAKPGLADDPTGNLVRGKYLVNIAGCIGCHGAAQLKTDAGIPLAGGMEYNLGPVGTYYAANLTTLQDWTYTDFDEALRQGIDPKTKRVLSPVMPYGGFYGLSDTDVASIAMYLKSLTPVQNDVAAAKPGALALFFTPLPVVSVPDPKIDDSADYGAYLVEHVANCGECHSTRNQQQQFIKGRELAGGTLNLGTADQPIYAPPILGSVLNAEGYTLNGFFTLLRTGIRPWGSQDPPQMPWRSFSLMTESDMTAIWNFLQTKKLETPATDTATMAATTAK